MAPLTVAAGQADQVVAETAEALDPTLTLARTPDQLDPLPIAAFLPTASAVAPVAARQTAVVSRRTRPVLMGWLIVILLAGSVLGLAGWLGDRYWSDPILVGGTVSAVLGLGLVASPWTGRPRWLAPVTGILLAGGAGALLLLSLFQYL